MALAHYVQSPIQRSQGQSAVAMAAYRRGARMENDAEGRAHDYTQKGDVREAGFIVPPNAPAWVTALVAQGDAGSERLWNAAEKFEKRKDAQPAFQLEIALQRELSFEENRAYVLRFLQQEFGDRGMLVDWAIHWSDHNPHLHAMVTTRELTETGFAPKKTRQWWNLETLLERRNVAEDITNRALLEAGWDVRVSFQSYAAQGIDLEPTRHRGPATDAMQKGGRQSDRAAEIDGLMERNRAAIEANPVVILDLLSRNQATFTEADIARALFRYFDDQDVDRYRRALARVMASDEIVALQRVDDRSRNVARVEHRYTTREMIAAEAEMAALTTSLSGTTSHVVGAEALQAGLEEFRQRTGRDLSEEQANAVHELLQPRQLSLLVGLAGAGKSTVMGAVRDVYAQQGYQVFGAAVAGIATENLQNEAGIESRTLAAWQAQWAWEADLQQWKDHGVMSPELRARFGRYLDWLEANGSGSAPETAAAVREQLASRDWTTDGWAMVTRFVERELARSPVIDSRTVFVIEEAGQVSSRQMRQILQEAARRGAKVIELGDERQLQPIEAGAAFRVQTGLAGYSHLGESRRQRIDWMQSATREFARDLGAQAMRRYVEHGKVHAGLAADPASTVEQLSAKFGDIGAADRERIETIVRYVEAKGAAGTLWRNQATADRRFADRADIAKWSDVRNSCASAISRDLAGYRPWLARLGISGEKLAADILVADGEGRVTATDLARRHARELGIYRIERELSDDQRVAVDVRSGAKANLVAAWRAALEQYPDAGTIILTHTKADATELNQSARAIARELGRLDGPDYSVATDAGHRRVAIGDRIVFNTRVRAINVQNGTRATITGIDDAGGRVRIEVRQDNGQIAMFDPETVRGWDLGYAVNVDRTQGLTEDRVFVLASSQFDAHKWNVAMTRHRYDAYVSAAVSDAPSSATILRGAGVSRGQDSTLDYAVVRGIVVPDPLRADSGQAPPADPPWIQRQRRAAAALDAALDNWDPPRLPPSRSAELPAAAASIAAGAGAIDDLARIAIDVWSERHATWCRDDLVELLEPLLQDTPLAGKVADAACRLPGVVHVGFSEHVAEEAQSDPEIIRTRGRYATAEMIGIEQEMLASSARLAHRADHRVPMATAQLEHIETKLGKTLTAEQRANALALLEGADIACLVGRAGSGKTLLIQATSEIFRAAGYSVYGAANAGIVAEALTNVGIDARTIAAWRVGLEHGVELRAVAAGSELGPAAEKRLARYLAFRIANTEQADVRDKLVQIQSQLDARTWSPDGKAWLQRWAQREVGKLPVLDRSSVLYVDEAGLIGSRDMQWLTAYAENAGAKIILVGDYEQLQPLSAGAPFRVQTSTVPTVELSEIWRQRTPWMQDATRSLFRREGHKAVDLYAGEGKISVAIEMDIPAFISEVENRFGPLTTSDKECIAVLAQYREAKATAGTVWSILSLPAAERPAGLLGSAQLAELQAIYRQAKSSRDSAARTIAHDLDRYKDWLPRLSVDPAKLAADILVARDRIRRQDAIDRAYDAARELGIASASEVPDTDRLVVDYRNTARSELIAEWIAFREEHPDRSMLLLAHANRDVAALNREARAAARLHGWISGADHVVQTSEGSRAFAAGDRIAFLEGNKFVGVSNGTLATVLAIEEHATNVGHYILSVKTDGGKTIAVDTSAYNSFDYGLALSYHKAQGVTVDVAAALASNQMDAHMGYVGLSRHIHDLRVKASKADAAHVAVLAGLIASAKSQDSTLDYPQARVAAASASNPASRMDRAARLEADPYAPGDAAASALVEEFATALQDLERLAARAARGLVDGQVVGALEEKLMGQAAKIAGSRRATALAQSRGLGTAVTDYSNDDRRTQAPEHGPDARANRPGRERDYEVEL